jgi:hypothetical protein
MKYQNKSSTSILCLFFCLAFPLFAQNENLVFVIETADFNIKGLTRSFALIRNGEIKIGEELNGRERLEKYVAEKTQLLLNQRVLSKAEITYTVGEQRTDGKYPVHLLIATEDTWNIIAIPYPKYDSNSGYELILKARDYNFLGTMNPLRLDIGYKYDEKEHSSLIMELTSDMPFMAFGYNWNFVFNHYFNYRPDSEEQFYYRNLTGLSMRIPFKTTTFSLGFDETVTLNEENDEKYWTEYGEFQKGPYMSSKPYISWEIPTGIIVGDYGSLTYKPELSATFVHGFQDWPLADFRKGPKIGFYHSLGFDRINWIGNYRRGLEAYMTNSYTYDFHQQTENREALSLNYKIHGIGHFTISDSFGVSAFLQYRHWFYHDPEYYDNAGDALRGILDKEIHADYMLSLNLDFPVRILRFMPSQWFDNRKLRLFDFEMHASPIIDLALYHDPEKDISFSFQNMLVSGGLELIVFPDFMRSLYLRISVAWNFVEQINNPRDYYLNPILPILPHLPDGGDREIFVGIGHHY